MLPETDDERVLKAACLVQQKNVAEVLLLGEANSLKQKFQKLKLESNGIEFVSLEKNKEVYADLMLEIRKTKTLLKCEALKLLEMILLPTLLWLFNGKKWCDEQEDQ